MIIICDINQLKIEFVHIFGTQLMCQTANTIFQSSRLRTSLSHRWRENNSEVTKPKPEVKDLTKLYQLIVRS